MREKVTKERSLCWEHVRRYVIDSIPLDSSEKGLPGSKGAEGREYIRLLSKVEERIKVLPYEEKVKGRQEASRLILNAFWSWVEKTSALSITDVLLTKAKLRIQPERVPRDLHGGWEVATDQQPMLLYGSHNQTVRDREAGLALCGYPERRESQRGTLHTGGERKGQQSGRVWVSKVLIGGDAGQPPSRTPGGHRPISAVVGRAAGRMPVKTQRQEVPQEMISVV